MDRIGQKLDRIWTTVGQEFDWSNPSLCDGSAADHARKFCPMSSIDSSPTSLRSPAEGRGPRKRCLSAVSPRNGPVSVLNKQSDQKILSQTLPSSLVSFAGRNAGRREKSIGNTVWLEG